MRLLPTQLLCITCHQPTETSHTACYCLPITWLYFKHTCKPAPAWAETPRVQDFKLYISTRTTARQHCWCLLLFGEAWVSHVDRTTTERSPNLYHAWSFKSCCCEAKQKHGSVCMLNSEEEEEDYIMRLLFLRAHQGLNTMPWNFPSLLAWAFVARWVTLRKSDAQIFAWQASTDAKCQATRCYSTIWSLYCYCKQKCFKILCLRAIHNKTSAKKKRFLPVFVSPGVLSVFLLLSVFALGIFLAGCCLGSSSPSGMKGICFSDTWTWLYCSLVSSSCM